MSWFVTPRQLARRAEFYQQLGQLTTAGISLPQACGMLRDSPPDSTYRAPLTRIHSHLQSGASFHDALLQTGRWIPAYEAALLQAGERSGRLPECFKLLADHYRQRSEMLRQIAGDLAYPFFLLHAAVFILPLPGLVLKGSLPVYLFQTLSILLPIYVGAFALANAMRGERSRLWRARLEQVLGRVPVLGAARRALTLARLATALHALLNAGVTIVEAWGIAARASGSPALEDTVASWKSHLEAGNPPGPLVAASPLFPEIFANLYQTGEVSGTLDESLLKLRAYFEEEGTRKLHLLAQWMPRLVYYLIAGAIAWKVLQFWIGYYGQLGDALKMIP